LTTIVMAIDITSALCTSKARGYSLVCWTLLPVLLLLQLMCFRVSIGKHCKPLPRSCVLICSGALAAVVIACVACFAAASLWLSVAWDDSSNSHPITSITELSGVQQRRAWALFLSDGYVDVKSMVSGHMMCKPPKKFHRQAHPCNFIYAAPIFKHAGDMGNPHIYAWAVSKSPIVADVHCREHGGLCGIAAQRLYGSVVLDRFRSLIHAQHSSVDPPMVFVSDPWMFLAPNFSCLVCGMCLGSGIMLLLLLTAPCEGVETSACIWPSSSRGTRASSDSDTSESLAFVRTAQLDA